jgi:peptidoglycan/LPS O-acetylase OafA/YrhL
MRNNIQTKIPFRNDILGLRGWAILLVLIYHFFPTILPRGYLGVDIFFVISGFLITSIFFTTKHYSYSEFIKKRIIRLVPSILITIFFCIIISLVIFLPFDLKNFSNSNFN